MGDTHGHTTSPSRHTRLLFFPDVVLWSPTQHKIFPIAYFLKREMFSPCTRHTSRELHRTSQGTKGYTYLAIFFFSFSYIFLCFVFVDTFFSFLSIVDVGVLRFLLLYIQTTTTMPRVVFDRHVDVYILNIYIFFVKVMECITRVSY